MTKDEIIQQKKNEALKSIRRILHPKTKNIYDHYCNESYSEQRESMIRCIIEQLEIDIKLIKLKYAKVNMSKQ